jgi:hypothetical protein
MYIYMYIYINVCVYMCMYECVCVCVCVCVCIYMYRGHGMKQVREMGSSKATCDADEAGHADEARHVMRMMQVYGTRLASQRHMPLTCDMACGVWPLVLTHATGHMR